MKKILLFSVLILSLVFCSCSKKEEEKQSVNRNIEKALPSFSTSQMELLLKKHTNSAFTEDVVTVAQIENILKAAVNSPSATNSKTLHFSAVMEEEHMKQISPKATKGCVVIVVSSIDSNSVDSGIATQSIYLAARANGLNADINTNGANIINTGNLKENYGVPNGYSAVSCICIGNAKENPTETYDNEIKIDEYVTYIE